MNELKPEDVMKALAWYEVVGKNIGSVTIPYNELQAITAQFREKDATLEMCAETIERQDKELAKKDMEIDRLNKEVDRLSQVVLYHDAFANDAIADARAEAITEFAERLKAQECLPEYPWDEPFVLARNIDQIANELKEEPYEQM